MRFSFVAAFAVVASIAPAFSLPLADLAVMARALKYRDLVDSDLMARYDLSSVQSRPFRIGTAVRPLGRRAPFVIPNGDEAPAACSAPGVMCLREESSPIETRPFRIGTPVSTLGRRTPFVIPNGDEAPAACSAPGVMCLREEVAPIETRPFRIGTPVTTSSLGRRAPFVIPSGSAAPAACSAPGVMCLREEDQLLARQIVNTFPVDNNFVSICGPNGENCKREEQYSWF